MPPQRQRSPFPQPCCPLGRRLQVPKTCCGDTCCSQQKPLPCCLVVAVCLARPPVLLAGVWCQQSRHRESPASAQSSCCSPTRPTCMAEPVPRPHPILPSQAGPWCGTPSSCPGEVTQDSKDPAGPGSQVGSSSSGGGCEHSTPFSGSNPSLLI